MFFSRNKRKVARGNTLGRQVRIAKALTERKLEGHPNRLFALRDNDLSLTSLPLFPFVPARIPHSDSRV
jgi:hypothetical protein